ncbi:MAG: TldD/PmbA family protein [Thermoplasmata archaeon]|nr:MAG: TldD/PmbA family protein [Thermoplasmata archaeon]
MGELDDELNVLLERGRKAVKLAVKLGADEADVYLISDIATSIEIENGSVNFSEKSTDNGIGLRVLKDGHVGFSYCTAEQELESTLKKALTVAKFSKKIEFNLPTPESAGKIPKIDKLFDKRILDLEAQAGLDMSKVLLQSAEEVHEDINISGGGIGFGYDITALVNSAGLEAGYYGTGIGASLSTVIQEDEDDVAGQGFEAFGSNMHEIDLNKIGRTAAELAVKSLKPVSIEGGELTVVFHPFSFSSLLEFTVIPSIYGEPVHKGESVYSDKKDQMVSAENVSLYDDPTVPGGIGSAPIDDEGLSSRRTVLIESGVLKNFLYDIATAAEFGQEPTGSGIRAERWDTSSDYHALPDTVARSIYLETKTTNFDDLIADISDGIFVYSIMGAHTANMVSGDFSVNSPTLFQIKNGELGKPCKPVMLSGNMPELMHSITGMADDFRMVDGDFHPTVINLGSVRVEKVKVTT